LDLLAPAPPRPPLGALLRLARLLRGAPPERAKRAPRPSGEDAGVEFVDFHRAGGHADATRCELLGERVGAEEEDGALARSRRLGPGLPRRIGRRADDADVRGMALQVLAQLEDVVAPDLAAAAQHAHRPADLGRAHPALRHEDRALLLALGKA